MKTRGTSNEAPRCNEFNLIVSPSSEERRLGTLLNDTVAAAARVFQECGLVAISSAIPPAAVRDFRLHAHRMAAPLDTSATAPRGREYGVADAPGRFAGLRAARAVLRSAKRRGSAWTGASTFCCRTRCRSTELMWHSALVMPCCAEFSVPPTCRTRQKEGCPLVRTQECARSALLAWDDGAAVASGR